MLTITTEAADAIKDIVEANELPAGSGLRITAEEDGNEVSIELDFADGPLDEDDVVETAGARVFLDETAAEVLGNVELTVTPHGDHVHFEFNERDAA
ncbi:MAG: iron-sulfur cluster biosynthesis family protein [Pseudomonadota bacterium]